MSMTDADFVALAKAMHCDPYALSNTEKLAISTLLLVEKRQLKDSTYLSHSTLSRCDVVIFAAFVVRFFCINGAKNRKDAVDFSDKYVSIIRAGGNHLYRRQPPSFSDIFTSRTAFYDRLLSGPGEMEDKFNNLVDEFTQIILTDFGSDTFTVFDEHSPYVIMDILNELDCRLEVNNFLNTLPDTIDSSFQRIQKNLREGRDADGREHTDASAHPAQPQPQQATSAPRTSQHGKHEAAKKTTPATAPSQQLREDIRKNPNQYTNIQPELKKEYDHINFTSSQQETPHKASQEKDSSSAPFPVWKVLLIGLLVILGLWILVVIFRLLSTSLSGVSLPLSSFTLAGAIFLTALLYIPLPVVIAALRKETITPRKYRWICYLVTLLLWVVIQAVTSINYGTYAGNCAPAVLWGSLGIWIGTKILKKKGLWQPPEKAEHTSSPKSSEGKEASYSVPAGSHIVPDVPASDSIPAVDTEEAISQTEPDAPLFCRRCGAQLPADSVFCHKCGTKVL